MTEDVDDTNEFVDATTEHGETLPATSLIEQPTDNRRYPARNRNQPQRFCELPQN